MYNSGWKDINCLTIFSGNYFIICNGAQHFSSDLVIFHCGGGSLNHQKVGHLGVDPRYHQHVYLLLLDHIHDMAYYGGSQDHRDPNHEVRQIWDYQGYLILIMALDSIYLNPYDDIANRLSKCIS